MPDNNPSISQPLIAINADARKYGPEPIEEYDENFWINGHAPKMIIFDDSSVANFKKYYSQISKICLKFELPIKASRLEMELKWLRFLDKATAGKTFLWFFPEFFGVKNYR